MDDLLGKFCWLAASVGLGVLASTGCNTQVFDARAAFVCETDRDCAAGYECLNSPSTGNRVCRAQVDSPQDAGAADIGAADAGPADSGSSDAAGQDAGTRCPGDRPCPSVAWNLLPGLLINADIEAGADDEFYLAADFIGRVEFGDFSIERQGTGAAIARLEADKTVRWARFAVSRADLRGTKTALGGDYLAVAFRILGRETLEVAGDSIEASTQSADDREVAVLIFDKATGDLLGHERFWSRGDLLVDDVGFDEDGDLWVALGAYGTLGGYGDSGETFEVQTDSVTVAEWQLDANGAPQTPRFSTVQFAMESVGKSWLAFDAGRGFLAVDVDADNSVLLSFSTSNISAGFDSSQQTLENLLISDVVVEQSGNLRLCGSLVGVTTFGETSASPLKASDIFLAEIDYDPDSDTWTPKNFPIYTNPVAESCAALVPRAAGGAVILANILGEASVEMDGVEVAFEGEHNHAGLFSIGNVNQPNWGRALTASQTLAPSSVAVLSSGRVVVTGDFAGRLSFDERTDEFSSASFILAFDPPQ